MPTYVADPYVDEKLEKIIAERQRLGHDRWDEVWEGVYVVSPAPNIEHQALVTGFTLALSQAIDPGQLGMVLPGCNVSDRTEDWLQNFRCPDVVAYLKDNPAINCETHWCGGPDFAVEVVSRHDRSREKLDFYAAVSTGELLIVDRQPWQLELFALVDGQLQSQGVAAPGDEQRLASGRLPLTFELLAGDPRPTISVRHTMNNHVWTI